MKKWRPTAGTPQGAVISPLLANLYLHPLDQHLASQGFKVVRYADDFVVLTKNASLAKIALREVRIWTEKNGLTLHPDKIHVGNCLRKGHGFDFLGYRFESRRRFVRKKSLAKFKDKIRELTARNSGKSLNSVIKELNRSTQGWFSYFKHAVKSTFVMLDCFTRRRLRALLIRRNKGKGFGKSHKWHKRWSNSFFVSEGLFTMVPMKAKAIEDARSLFDGIPPI